MDPEATLRQAESAVSSGDKASAFEYLTYYEDWRRGGGFEPENGDARAGKIWDAISDVYGEDPQGYGQHVEGYENPGPPMPVTRYIAAAALTIVGAAGFWLGRRTLTRFQSPAPAPARATR